jgi:hypothetical protein
MAARNDSGIDITTAKPYDSGKVEDSTYVSRTRQADPNVTNGVRDSRGADAEEGGPGLSENQTRPEG